MRLRVICWGRLWFAVALAGLPLAAPGAGNDSANVAAQYHCAGSARLTSNTNLVALNKISVLPSTTAFQKVALQRLSRLLAGGVRFGTNTATLALIEPLWKDVLTVESAGGFGGRANDPINFVVALRVDGKEAQLWQDNFTALLGGPGEKFTVEDFVGRRWNRANSNLIWIIPAGSWVIAGCGDDLSPLRDKYLQQLKAQGRPVPVLKENWLEADADWGRLTTWLPDWARLVKPAHLEVSVTVVTNHLRMTAHIVYPEAISWRLEPWNIPTNLIQSPLDSLTAAQDIAAILNPSPTLTRVCGTLLTNQFYAWAMGEMPLQTYVAWPVANASNVLAELSTEAPAAFNADMEKLNGADLVWQPEFNRLYLPKLGIGSPDLSAAEDHGQQFLLSTLFPLSPVGKPAPDQLLKQIIGRTNLVYFDREVTGPRLQEWRMLGDILFHRLGARPREIGIAKGFEAKWLDGLRPLAGNTSTEITRVAPNELLAVRNSPVGLTGIEIYLFSEWLSAAGYYPTNAPPSAH